MPLQVAPERSGRFFESAVPARCASSPHTQPLPLAVLLAPVFRLEAFPVLSSTCPCVRAIKRPLSAFGSLRVATRAGAFAGACSVLSTPPTASATFAVAIVIIVIVIIGVIAVVCEVREGNSF